MKIAQVVNNNSWYVWMSTNWIMNDDVIDSCFCILFKSFTMWWALSASNARGFSKAFVCPVPKKTPFPWKDCCDYFGLTFLELAEGKGVFLALGGIILWLFVVHLFVTLSSGRKHVEKIYLVLTCFLSPFLSLFGLIYFSIFW